jgi:hypothetical protein
LGLLHATPDPRGVFLCTHSRVASLFPPLHRQPSSAARDLPRDLLFNARTFAEPRLFLHMRHRHLPRARMPAAAISAPEFRTTIGKQRLNPVQAHILICIRENAAIACRLGHENQNAPDKNKVRVPDDPHGAEMKNLLQACDYS